MDITAERVLDIIDTPVHNDVHAIDTIVNASVYNGVSTCRTVRMNNDGPSIHPIHPALNNQLAIGTKIDGLFMINTPANAAKYPDDSKP